MPTIELDLILAESVRSLPSQMSEVPTARAMRTGLAPSSLCTERAAYWLDPPAAERRSPVNGGQTRTEVAEGNHFTFWSLEGSLMKSSRANLSAPQSRRGFVPDLTMMPLA